MWEPSTSAMYRSTLPSASICTTQTEVHTQPSCIDEAGTKQKLLSTTVLGASRLVINSQASGRSASLCDVPSKEQGVLITLSLYSCDKREFWYAF